PGSRVEAMRAGINTRVDISTKGPEKSVVESGKTSHGRRPYRCCNDQAKDLVSAQIGRPGRSKQRAVWSRAVGLAPTRGQGSQGRMDSFEYNKLIGAFLG